MLIQPNYNHVPAHYSVEQIPDKSFQIAQANTFFDLIRGFLASPLSSSEFNAQKFIDQYRNEYGTIHPDITAKDMQMASLALGRTKFDLQYVQDSFRNKPDANAKLNSFILYAAQVGNAIVDGKLSVGSAKKMLKTEADIIAEQK
jgi:hypothetical protein